MTGALSGCLGVGTPPSHLLRFLTLPLLAIASAATAAGREDLFRQYTDELAKLEEGVRERENKQREAERRLEAEQKAAGERQRQVRSVWGVLVLKRGAVCVVVAALVRCLCCRCSTTCTPVPCVS